MITIYKRAIKFFGPEAQKTKAIEELAELIVALAKGDLENIAEEIADVEIMMEQLKVIYQCHEKTAKVWDFKIKRLLGRIDPEEELT